MGKYVRRRRRVREDVMRMREEVHEQQHAGSYPIEDKSGEDITDITHTAQSALQPQHHTHE